MSKLCIFTWKNIYMPCYYGTWRFITELTIETYLLQIWNLMNVIMNISSELWSNQIILKKAVDLVLSTAAVPL